MATNLGGPGENRFLVRVQQDERVLLVQARDLWSLGLLLRAIDNHLLLYLVGPHEGLLRTHRVALGLNPWLKVVVVIVMSFELT